MTHESPVSQMARDDLGQYPTSSQLDDACLSFRHDFGLLEGEDRQAVRRQALDWLRCWRRAFNIHE